MPALTCFAGSDAGPIAIRSITIEKGDDVVVRVNAVHPDTLGPWNFTGWTFESKAKSADGVTTWATGVLSTPDATGSISILFPNAQTSLLTDGDVGLWYLKGTDTGSLVHTLVQGTATVTAAP